MPIDRPVPRIAIATSALLPSIHPDDELFVALLNELGIRCEAAVWNDEAVDWRAFDAVLIRSTWDYVQHYAAYLHWLDLLERFRLQVLNPVRLLRWNSNKRYLLDLERLGVTIIPTQIVAASELPAHVCARAGEELVIKPTVSATSWHTIRGVAGSSDFDAAVAALPTNIEFLVQPFLPEIATEGEWSLLLFGSEYSHCVLKRPACNDYRVQNEFGGSTHEATPTQAILDSARHALHAVEKLGHGSSCYARIDGVRRDGQLLIMEVEMIEPSLYFNGNVAASRRFAHAIAACLRKS
jgi:glutathione synthase/RimK-type ligase-like ATP-grasp enzyme